MLWAECNPSFSRFAYFEQCCCFEIKASYCTWFSAKKTEICSISRTKKPTVLVSWKEVMWPSIQCLPKELFRVILILCDFSFCANIRTSSKRKCFFIVCSQVRNTKKFLKGKINRIMSDDGQGKFWVGGNLFSLFLWYFFKFSSPA